MSTTPRGIGRFDESWTRREQLRAFHVYQAFVAAAGSRSFAVSAEVEERIIRLRQERLNPADRAYRPTTESTAIASTPAWPRCTTSRLHRIALGREHAGTRVILLSTRQVRVINAENG